MFYKDAKWDREKVWTGNKSASSHLKVFRSLCYKHPLDQQRKKLHDKSEVMILVSHHPIRLGHIDYLIQ